ncbi:hypothetical protein ACW9I9_19055 [Pseudomonas pergaminensis]|nr:hypothetical protein [Pseudomonas sp.]
MAASIYMLSWVITDLTELPYLSSHTSGTRLPGMHSMISAIAVAFTGPVCFEKVGENE